MPIIRDQFDFEVGTLIKSPCRPCDKRKEFPECIDACLVLDQLQKRIAKGISLTRSLADSDDFDIGPVKNPRH